MKEEFHKLRKNLKEVIFAVLLSAYISFLRIRRIFIRSTVRKSSVLFLPPYSPGSLGDEAILTAGIRELAGQGIEKFGLVSFKLEDNWEYLTSVTQIFVMQDYFSYGSWRDRFRFAHLASQYEQIYLFGTDMMDGFYHEGHTLKQITLVALAAKIGAKTTIASFSFNKNPTRASLKALGNLPPTVRLCSRDPVSQARLIHHLGRPIELVADVAFLLPPAKESEMVSFVLRWIRSQKSAGRIVIGLNVNFLLLEQVMKVEQGELIKVFASTITELSSRCKILSFILIPHDIRGKISDVILANALKDAIHPELKPYCMQVPPQCTAAEIKTICAAIDGALSGRMHLAIACLGQGTPVGCITYQDKFEGLFQHFELDGLTIDPEQALQPEKLSNFFLPLIQNREEIHQHILSKLPEIRRLARANFA